MVSKSRKRKVEASGRNGGNFGDGIRGRGDLETELSEAVNGRIEIVEWGGRG